MVVHKKNIWNTVAKDFQNYVQQPRYCGPSILPSLLVSKKIGSRERIAEKTFKGQLGVPVTVYPWYLLCSLGILGDYNL